MFIFLLGYYYSMTAKRSISLESLIDEAVAKLAIQNNTTYSGYINMILSQHPTILKTVRQLEQLPEFPELTDAEIEAEFEEAIPN